MAKLVIGTNKQTVVPAVVRDMSPAYYIEKTLDANNKLQNSVNVINLNGVTGLSDGILSYQYNKVVFPANTNIDLSSLTTISGENCCYNAFLKSKNIKSVDLSNLTTIYGEQACAYIFGYCEELTDVDLSSLTTISGKNGFAGAFVYCKSIKSIDLSSLTTVDGEYACQTVFYGCSELTSVDLSSLTTISGNSACNQLFFNLPKIESVDLSSLTTISGGNACNNMFGSSKKITRIDLPNLTSLSGGNVFMAFGSNCESLLSVSFDKLSVISSVIAASYSSVFYNCPKLQSITFGGLKASTFSSAVNQIQYLVSGTTGRDAPNGCTIHFPSNFDPSDPNHTFDASTLAGYPTFSGNAQYVHVAFDLPATE